MKITEEMRDLGLSQSDLAKLTGKHRVTVWRWCVGDVDAPVWVQTILRQQRQIQSLSKALEEPK